MQPDIEKDRSFIGQFQQMGDDIKEIKDALLGNEFNENGIIKRVGKLEDKHNHLREDFNNIKYKVIGAGIAITIAINIISFIIKLVKF